MPEARGGEGEGVEMCTEWDMMFACFHCRELSQLARVFRNRETGEVRLVCEACVEKRYEKK